MRAPTHFVAPQFIRYVGAGAVGTAAHYAVLIALVQIMSTPAVAASTAGALVGALINYALNHRFTFASSRAHRMALPRFLAIAGLGIVLNAAVMWAVLVVVPSHYLFAQVAATAAVLFVGFVANRRWTF